MPMPCRNFAPQSDFPDTCQACGFLKDHHGYFTTPPMPERWLYDCDLCAARSVNTKPGMACTKCKTVLAELILDKTILGSSSRDAACVPPQADSIHFYRHGRYKSDGCRTCGEPETAAIHRVPTHMDPSIPSGDGSNANPSGYFMGPAITFSVFCDTSIRYPLDNPCPHCGGTHTLPINPYHAQEVVAVAEWLADDDKRRAMGIGTAEPACTCGIGNGLHNDRCPVFIWGHANKIGFGYPSDPEGVKYQAINRAARFAANHATEPLVKPERRIDILSFRNALERICEAYGVKLKADMSGSLLIIDTRNPLPEGHDCSAWIDRAGVLIFAERIVEPETGATKK